MTTALLIKDVTAKECSPKDVTPKITPPKSSRPKIQMLAVSKTAAGDNDRTVFNDAELEDMAKSIADNGLIQPISVRAKNGGYQIIAGERRFRALSQKLGWTTFPAIVLEADDEAASAIMLAENTARANIDPIDEARAYQKRIAQFGWSTEEVGKRAGVSGSRVRARLKLLRLEDTVQKLTRSGQFPMSYAQLLVDADLPFPAQLSAMRIFNNQLRPTLDWFQGVVSELEKVKQTEMFDVFELEMMVQQAPAAGDTPNPKKLPRPMKTKAPTIGGTPAEILRFQLAFWRTASEGWKSLNSTWYSCNLSAP